MKVEFIQKKPFCVFVIKDFLTLKEYNFLKKNFYNIKKGKFKRNFGDKFSVNSEDDIYELLKKENNSIRLIEKKFDEKFFIEVFKSLRKYIIISRLKFIKLWELFRLLKKPSIETNKSIFKKITKSSFRRNIQFSYMGKNSFIRPHTDKMSKLISLMLYFPSKNLENLNIGTHFYNGGTSNFKNISENKFPNKSKKVFSIPFNGRHLYGFIKSDISWHYVKKLKIQKNEIRKSININLHSH